MGKLVINDMVFFSKHGCFEEERVIGNKFIVNLSAETDMTLPAKSDSLDDAVNYAEVYAVVKEEMEKPSKLMENLASRILERVKSEFPALLSIDITVSKLNPPIGGEVGAFTVKMSYAEDGKR